MCNAVQYSFKCITHVNFHSVDFTFILNGPLRNIKSRFHCVSLSASGFEHELTTKQAVMVKLSLSMPWRQGMWSRFIASLILNLRARHIEFSTLFCSQSPRPHPRQITCDSYWIEGWLGFRDGCTFMKRKISCPCRDLNPGPSNL